MVDWFPDLSPLMLLREDELLQFAELMVTTEPLILAVLAASCHRFAALLRYSATVGTLREAALLKTIRLRDGKQAATQLRLLLEQGVAISGTDETGASLLHTACRQAHAAVVALLLRAGATIDGRDDYGRTPLFVACQAGHQAVVRVLLGARGDANLANARGILPWQAACAEGHSDTMAMVLNANQLELQGGEVVLHLYALGTSSAHRHLHSLCSVLGSGLFHTAIEVRHLSGGLEWSFGYTDAGVGVFSREAGENPEHRYSHSVSLGSTRLTQVGVKRQTPRLKQLRSMTIFLPTDGRHTPSPHRASSTR